MSGHEDAFTVRKGPLGPQGEASLVLYGSGISTDTAQEPSLARHTRPSLSVSLCKLLIHFNNAQNYDMHTLNMDPVEKVITLVFLYLTDSWVQSPCCVGKHGMRF